MARSATDVCFVLASPLKLGVRTFNAGDLPTRTVTADGTTYRCEWHEGLMATVVTKVGKANQWQPTKQQ